MAEFAANSLHVPWSIEKRQRLCRSGAEIFYAGIYSLQIACSGN